MHTRDEERYPLEGLARPALDPHPENHNRQEAKRQQHAQREDELAEPVLDGEGDREGDGRDDLERGARGVRDGA